MRQFNFEVGKVDMYYNIKLHYVESRTQVQQSIKVFLMFPYLLIFKMPSISKFFDNHILVT